MLCMGDSLLLDATIIDATNYLWQDSSTLPTLKVFESGMYIVEVEIECATFKDTIIVQFNTHPEVSLGQDTTLCLGDTLLLGAFTPNGIYRWQDESDLEQFKVETSGEYWVEVKNECATSSDTINIIGIQSPVLNLEPTVSICENDIVTLNVSAPNSNYLWQDSTTSPIYDISIPGAYWVQVSNSCGEAADTMYVNWSECECNVYVPNVFTPNHDNINDRFMPWFSCEIKVYEILIFNRWGELVYSSKDLGEYWNGSYHGKDCQSGVYGYLLSYTTYSGESDHKYGDITLLR